MVAERPGYCLLEIAGDNRLMGEAGGHRIQRVPPTEMKGRVHTSTVTVAVTRAAPVASFDPKDCDVEWYSGSGAGGQHRNKHQNSCRMRHRPTGLVRTAQTRDRENSYRLCLDAMKVAVEERAMALAAAAVNAGRREQIGSGQRGDKRRTYRFRDDQVADHVTGKSARCSDVMRGRFDLLWS